MVGYFERLNDGVNLGSTHLRYRRDTLGISAEEDEARWNPEEVRKKETLKNKIVKHFIPFS
jgi:hypothetical protein